MQQLEQQLAAAVRAAELRAGDTVVDYGCGDQPYRKLFEDGIRYIAADFSSEPGADVHFDAEGQVPIADGTAALVLSTQVLEHVESPARYLRESHRLLRSGGTLVLSTHGCFQYHPHPTDYWRWTRDGLAKILAEAGFAAASWSGVVGAAAAGIQYFADHTEHKVPQTMRPLFHRVVQGLVATFDRRYSPEGRLTDPIAFVVRARKI